jgi:TldD protein
MTVMAAASDGGGNQTGYLSPGAQRGFEFFDSFDPYETGRQSAQTALIMLGAPYCPAGRMPVAIENGYGGVLFHEACGHSLESASLSKGSSEFSGKLGLRIASPIVSAADDATIPYAYGSVNVDDEGNPGQNKLLIENGILKGFIIDRLGGRRMNLPSSGSGRRQNYKFAPASRMSNTFILPGSDEDEEILSSMAYGLYCRRMGGGSVNTSTGEFNFSVAEGYIVKNGTIDRPVRGATLIGRGSEALLRIDRVGKNPARAQGTCGAQSGSVPAEVGQPLIRVSEMTVGGREGAE